MKKLVLFVCLFTSIVVLIHFVSCNKKGLADLPFISPPVPELIPQYTNFDVDADKGDTLSFPSGTKIFIPAGVFTDTSGNLIKGKVQVQYREFHNAGEILLAGVPMKYDSGGSTNYLRTSGMFDIRAKQNNNDLKIAKDKSIQINMASYNEEKNFNFYYLDEKQKNWNYVKRDSARRNTDKDSILLQLAELENSKNKPFTPDYFVFNYLALLDVKFEKNYYSIRDFSKNKAMADKFKEYGISWSGITNPTAEYSSYGTLYDYEPLTVNYNGYSYNSSLMLWKNLGKAVPKWAINSKLTSIKKKDKNIYEIVVKSGVRKYSTQLELVMPLKFLLAKTPEQWKKNFDANMAELNASEQELMAKLKKEAEERKKREEELKRQAEMIANVFRVSNISTLGYHNWDVIQKFDDRIIVNATIKIIDSEVKPGELYYYYIIKNGGSYVRFSKPDFEKLELIPDSSAKIMTFLANGTPAVFTSDQYRKIDFGQLKSAQKPSYTFELKSYNKLTKPEEIKSILAM